MAATDRLREVEEADDRRGTVKKIDLVFRATKWIGWSSNPHAYAQIDAGPADDPVVLWRVAVYADQVPDSKAIRVFHGETTSEKNARAAIRRALARYLREKKPCQSAGTDP